MLCQVMVVMPPATPSLPELEQCYNCYKLHCTNVGFSRREEAWLYLGSQSLKGENDQFHQSKCLGACAENMSTILMQYL